MESAKELRRACRGMERTTFLLEEQLEEGANVAGLLEILRGQRKRIGIWVTAMGLRVSRGTKGGSSS